MIKQGRRRPLIRLSLAASTAALLLGACAVQPSVAGKSPSPAPTSASASSQSPFQDTSSNATEEASPSSEPSSTVADFNQVVSYDDGAEVEVTKIKHGLVSKDDAEYTDGVKAGADYVEMTVKATNKGDSDLTDLGSYSTLTYGPDGDEADEVYLNSSSRNDISIDGTIRPGKSKTSLIRVAVPKKYQDDVQLEFDLGGHDTAGFAGSVK
jgi:hypothetical protein